jgi:hypothetical protein
MGSPSPQHNVEGVPNASDNEHPEDAKFRHVKKPPNVEPTEKHRFPVAPQEMEQLLAQPYGHDKRSTKEQVPQNRNRGAEGAVEFRPYSFVFIHTCNCSRTPSQLRLQAGKKMIEL